MVGAVSGYLFVGGGRVGFCLRAVAGWLADFGVLRCLETLFSLYWWLLVIIMLVRHILASALVMPRPICWIAQVVGSRARYELP